MAHRDQIRRALRAHNAGGLGDGEHVPLRDLSPTDLLERLRLHEHAHLCGGGSECVRFFRHIHHPCPAGLVKVRKFSHYHSTSRLQLWYPMKGQVKGKPGGLRSHGTAKT